MMTITEITSDKFFSKLIIRVIYAFICNPAREIEFSGKHGPLNYCINVHTLYEQQSCGIESMVSF